MTLSLQQLEQDLFRAFEAGYTSGHEDGMCATTAHASVQRQEWEKVRPGYELMIDSEEVREARSRAVYESPPGVVWFKPPPVSVDEAKLLAHALAEEASSLRMEASDQPLRHEGPETRRYLLLDEAAALEARSREFAETVAIAVGDGAQGEAGE